MGAGGAFISLQPSLKTEPLCERKQAKKQRPETYHKSARGTPTVKLCQSSQNPSENQTKVQDEQSQAGVCLQTRKNTQINLL